MGFQYVDLALFIIFIIFLGVFLLIRRKQIGVQKIASYFLYLILYRSNFGIKFMKKISEKYRELIKFFGYCCVGLGVFLMVYVSFGILLMLVKLVREPVQDAGVALVLPFTNIPGIGYLSFMHWIIAIFILAVVHEFSHGIVAKAHGLKIKSSGFAFFSVFVPIIPAAFVEPDEKEIEKKEDIVQYSIFAAGPMANIFLALIILLAMPFAANPYKLAPFEGTITEPIGFSMDLVNDSLPAAQAGLTDGMIITKFNGADVKDANSFIEAMYCVMPGDKIELEADGRVYDITAGKADDREKGFIGVTNFKNEVRVKEEYDWLKIPYYWLKDLIKWVFLLNFFIGLFNLLPIGIVDGGRMLKTFLSRVIDNKARAMKIWGLISLFFLMIILLGLVSTYIGKLF